MNTQTKINLMTNEQQSLLESILSCVNAETKSVALLATTKDFENASQIFNRIQDIVPAYPIDIGATRRYFIPCFVPQGVVDVREKDASNKFGVSYEFRISHLGLQIAQPAALLALQYSAENEVSIKPILGRAHNSPTQSSGVMRNAQILQLFADAKEEGLPYSGSGIGLIPHANANISSLLCANVLRNIGTDDTQIQITTVGQTFVDQFLNPLCDAIVNPIQLQSLQERLQETSPLQLSATSAQALTNYRVRPGGRYISFDERNSQIYGMILARPGISRKELTVASGLHMNSVNWHLRDMVAKKQVRAVEDGFYNAK